MVGNLEFSVMFCGSGQSAIETLLHHSGKILDSFLGLFYQLC
jgi:hypothetical protein